MGTRATRNQASQTVESAPAARTIPSLGPSPSRDRRVRENVEGIRLHVYSRADRFTRICRHNAGGIMIRSIALPHASIEKSAANARHRPKFGPGPGVPGTAYTSLVLLPGHRTARLARLR